MKRERQAMLEIQNLHARAGDTGILKGIDLVVYPGEVHAVMGPNGSGKSTLMHLMTGLLRPTRGEISVLGIRPDAHIVVACLEDGAEH